MEIIPFFLLAAALLQACYAPPVTQTNKEGPNVEDNEVGGLEDYMEYHRYLKEVVNALESDPDFRAKLEKADENDIKSGKIAEELEFVSHNVRTRLDEIKRVELERLKELTEQKMKLTQGIDDQDPTHKHLDHANPHTFEIDDLKKLIAKTTEDLAEADKKRRDEFKTYEMQKEYDKQVKINNTTDEEQKHKLEKEYQEREEKHKKHEKLHQPGHKAQLEEVWEEQDQMQQEFDPKTFFMLHDVDGNGLWDQDEVKALFIKELEKMYQQGAPEDDWRERAEEMERMREYVFKEVDLNRDGFIDFQEFLARTKKEDFAQDQGWQSLDERKPYTDEELNAYIQQHQRMQPPQYYQGHPGQGYPGGGYPQQGYHPNAVPQQYHQQPPQGNLNTNEIHQQQQPGGYQQPPQGYHPQQGYQQPPQGYQQHGPPQGYQQHPQQGYQQHPQQGYQQHPQQGYQQHPPQGYQPPPPQAYQQQPQGFQQQQGNQLPQGQQQQQQQQQQQAVNQQKVPNQQAPVQQQVPVQQPQQQNPVQPPVSVQPQVPAQPQQQQQQQPQQPQQQPPQQPQQQPPQQQQQQVPPVKNDQESPKVNQI